MKKYLGIISIILLLALSSAIVAADEYVEIGDDTIDESIGVEIDPEMVQLRFAQLQEQITEKIAQAQDVIARINEKYPDKDTSELEAMITEFEVLLADAEALAEQEPSEELRDEYITLKEESRALVTEFREIARGLADLEEQKAIREEIKNKRYEEVEAKKAQVQEMRENYDHKVWSDMLKRQGTQDNELLERLEKGEASREEVKEAAKENLAEKTAEERREFLNEFKETKEKEQERVRAEVEQNKEEFQQRVEEMRKEMISLREQRTMENPTGIDRQQITDLISAREATKERIDLGGMTR